MPRGAEIGIEVLARIPLQEHNRLLVDVPSSSRGAEGPWCVLRPRAAGLGRPAADPVVATSIPGVSGYEHLAVAMVSFGDPRALRRGVDRHLADPHAVAAQPGTRPARRLAAARSRYAEKIRTFLDDSGAPASLLGRAR